jgi:modulator of FtsH protease
VAHEWSDFYVTVGGAAAALTGLLFVAVSLRPREIRESVIMVGRARSAFYAFATVVLVSLLALAGTDSRLIGLAQAAVPVAVLVASSPFTLRSIRSHTLNYGRASAYHVGLVVVAVAGVARVVSGIDQTTQELLSAGIVILIAIALSNSWQLVLSHDEHPT